jgi:type VI secretion system protein ImpA
MDRIPLQTLLQPCASDGGVGRNLEYDSRHLAMCQSAEGTPEQEYGQTLIAAQQPDWRKLYALALELSIESRDLRAAVYLTESLCRLQGFDGLSDGLQLVLGWSTQFWSELYPQLDPSDDNDPVERLGTLNRLCRGEYLLGGIQRLTLAQCDALGRVTFYDLKQTAATPEERAQGLTREEIQAIFLSEPIEELRQTADTIQRCVDSAEQLSRFVEQQLGVGQWDATPLIALLRDCSSAVENAYAARAGNKSPRSLVVAPTANNPALSVATEETVTGAQASQLGSPVQASVLATQKMNIATRAEAMAVLDSLCAYFETHEPASPVPLLLQRAKRLIPMSFVDILRELAPDGLQQAMQSVGATRGES